MRCDSRRSRLALLGAALVAFSADAFTVPLHGKAAWTSSRVMMMTSGAAGQEPPAWTMPGYRRPLHWVFKIGDLKKSLDFYEQDFGMHVHRHEEFASGCEATCNGPYGAAWSKTMCGYGTEEKNFALELTYNYGIDSYESGNDLRYIAMDARAYKGQSNAVETDKEGRRFVTAPDGYKYLLVDTGANGPVPKEPFLLVSIHVSDLAQSEKFYREVLGAYVYSGVPGAARKPKTLVVGFEDEGVKLELVQLPAGQKVDHKLASGRFATETEDGAPDYMADKVKNAGGTILHGPFKLQPHGEEVVIVADPDSFEFCFVDARGYKNCVDVRDAKDGRKVDWEYRQKLEAAARSGPKAKLEVAKVLAGDYDKEGVRSKIATLLKENPVVVFAQVNCPYCTKAKALLKELDVKYKLVEVDAMGTEGYAFRVELNGMTGRSSVPNIFINGENVGGFGDGPGLEALHKEGKLVALLSGKTTLAEVNLKAKSVAATPAADELPKATPGASAPTEAKTSKARDSEGRAGSRGKAKTNKEAK